MISRRDILDLETRRNIYNYILKNPGLHFRELERKTNIPEGTLKYHLKFLKKRELITTETTGRYQNYFIKEKVGRKDKKVLGLLQKEIYHNLIIGILMLINCTRNILIEELDLDMHPNTVAYHLKKLQDLDIIEIAPIEDGEIHGVKNSNPPIVEYQATSSEKFYRLKDPQYIYDLLITFKEEIKEDSLLHFLMEAIEQRETYGYKKRGYIRTRKEKVDRMLERFYEVFPPPYYF